MQLNRLISLHKFIKRGCSTTTEQILMKVTKAVEPFSRINIKSSMNLTIKPYDLLDCPNANILRASIITSNKELITSVPLETTKSNLINIDVRDKIVNIINMHGSNDVNKNCTCMLEIPVKSDIDVNTESNVTITNMHSDLVKVQSLGDISTKNLRSINVQLNSIKGGNINCKGILLAQDVYVETTENGTIKLDKLQGITLNCRSLNGKISTNSCYVNNSKFLTHNGKLNLQNVHKNTEVILLGTSSLKMVGIHGNIIVKANKCDMDLQFDELHDDNLIITNGNTVENLISISLSDKIEKNCSIKINSNQINLEDSLKHLKRYLNQTNNEFIYNQNAKDNAKLLISTESTVRLCKMSWADVLKTKISNSLSETTN